MRGLVSSERLRGVVVSAETVSGSEFLTRRMLSVRNSLQRERSGNANARDAEFLHYRAADSGRGLEQVDGRPYRFAEGFARSIRHRRILLERSLV